MLTADLVLARRRGAELRLIAIDDADRARARAIAERIVETTREHVGRTREELDAALAAIDVAPHEERWKAGLAKLMDDRATWDDEGGDSAPSLRQSLFHRASAARRLLGPADAFDRAAIVDAVAAEHGLDAGAFERALYADLRGAHALRAIDPITPALLVDAWERGQAQAVLLRATRVTLDVRCATAGATRALFHRLKFLRLLHTITPNGAKDEDGHRIVIDGPFSLFESSTKYGLKLALVLPVLDGCESWKLEADVRWGKDRTPLLFRLESGANARAPSERGAPEAPALPDEVAALVRAFERLETRHEKRHQDKWRVTPSRAILDLPGVGLCVPDLVFTRGRGKEACSVHLEVMGFWSRDAVWRRVDLVQRGLAAPILFAVSARLRVSEEVLGEDMPSALYVYKGTMSARVIAERIDVLAARRVYPVQATT